MRKAIAGFTAVAALFALAVSTAGTRAHIATTPEGTILTQKVRAADAIIRGVVTKVSYRMSERSSQAEPPLPHTFVTYRVREIMKGEGEMGRLTLRFMGGPDGAGGYMTVQDVPFFEEGDEDILLIQGNGEAVCPLVQCDEGRYRLVDDRVYTNAGRALFLSEKGTLIRGAESNLESRRVEVPGLDEKLAQRTAELRERLLKEAPEEIREELRKDWREGAAEQPRLEEFNQSDARDRPDDEIASRAGAEPLTAKEFTALLGRILQQERGVVGKLITVDPDAPFKVPAPSPAAPRTAEAPDDGMTEQERRELEMMEESGGNPVLQ